MVAPSERSNGIRADISNSSEGSEIHGLIEKIAFRFHKNYPCRTDENNWFLAQEVLSSYLENKCSYIIGHIPIPEHVKVVLQFDAYKDRYQRTPFDNWIEAQDTFTNRVMDYFNSETNSQELLLREFN